MSIFNTLFAVPKIVDTAAEVVTKGTDMLDKAFYTDQEKAENNNKLMAFWLELQKMIANDTGISAAARRVVAYMITEVFLFLILMACIVWKIDKEWSEFILKTIDKTDLSYLMLLVGFFFFGFYAFGKYMGGVFQKKE